MKLALDSSSSNSCYRPRERLTAESIAHSGIYRGSGGVNGRVWQAEGIAGVWESQTLQWSRQRQAHRANDVCVT